MSRQSSAVAQLSATALRHSTLSRASVASTQRLCRLENRRSIVTNAKDANIAVLGGGLTGLSTAYYLAKKLPSTTKITLYESSKRLGGWIRTERTPVDVGGKSGIVSFERGPRSLTSLYGNTFRFDDLVLYDLALDLGLAINSPPSKPRYIYYPDHIVPLPPNISIGHVFTEPLYLQGIGASLGLALNSWRSRRLPQEDQSVADWLYSISNSRKGAGTFASAMMHGIYGGDINKLSARCVLDRVYWGWYLPNPGMGVRPMPPGEEKILAELGQDRQIQKLALEPKSPLIDFGEAGMESLPQAMASALKEQPNVTIKLDEPIKKVSYDKANKRVKITGSNPKQLPTSYDKVISTLSAQDIARLSDSAALPTFSKFHSVSIMTVNLWFPQEDLKPPGFGYLIPNSVDPSTNPEHALGVFFDSDVSTRSKDEPAGTKLFVLMGGHYYDQPGVTPPTEEEAILQARDLLERHLGIPRDAPCHAVAGFANNCIPQHFVGHQDRLMTAKSELHESFGGRLAVAGGSFSRIGAVAALRAGYDAAVAASEGLDATGLEYLDTLREFAVVPIEKIPVRHLK